MFRKRLLHLTQLSAVALGGYYAGQNKDNIFNFVWENSITIDGKRIKNMPGLPVFGTVSAATPFVESGSKDRVINITKLHTFFY